MTFILFFFCLVADKTRNNGQVNVEKEKKVESKLKRSNLFNLEKQPPPKISPSAITIFFVLKYNQTKWSKPSFGFFNISAFVWYYECWHKHKNKNIWGSSIFSDKLVKNREFN